MKDGPFFTPFALYLEAAMERARQRRKKEAVEEKKVVSINSRRRPADEAGNDEKKDV